jgi:hypothetical protein
MATKVLLLAALLGVATAIYPDDHWSYSTKLTTSNIDAEIKNAVDGGKTLFGEVLGFWLRRPGFACGARAVALVEPALE